MNAREAEKNRIINDKAVAAAKRLQAEKDEQNAIVFRKKEKEEFMNAKK